MIALRDATPADAEALAALTDRCDVSQRDWAGEAMTVPGHAQVLADWRQRLARPGGDVRVAEEHGLVLAGSAWAPARGTHGGSDGPVIAGLGHVSAVFVDPPQWRRGIARTLVADLERLMRAGGMERARLWTLEGSPAERLYARCGWTRTDERGVHPPTGMAIVQYVRELG